MGKVINKLSKGKTGDHIPYRDSKLTRILQPALGGNSNTAIICTITQSTLHTEESLSTLQFACRAKEITNTVTVNEVLDNETMFKRLQLKGVFLKKEKFTFFINSFLFTSL